MKATGIVRRIDELGRVVIPKEIRRTLRIKEGDPLEIFTEKGELMLKKYSPIASLENIAELTARSLSEASGYLAVIADTDEILSADGNGKRDLGRRLSRDVENVLKERRSHLAERAFGGNVLPVTEADSADYSCQLIVPIVSGGDCLGGVMLLDRNREKVEEYAVKLAKLTAEMLAHQFE